MRINTRTFGRALTCLALAALAVSALRGNPALAAGIAVDGDLSDWNDGLLVATKTGSNESVDVYAYGDCDMLFLGFEHSGGDAGNDYRGDTVTGADNVLDFNLGLEGSTQSRTWRWALRSKANQANEAHDLLDGFYASWEDTHNPKDASEQPPTYYDIPDGVQMVTDFSSGNRVTEVGIPMELLFDGEAEWDSPIDSASEDDDLLLAGLALSTGDAWSAGDALFFPDGWDSNDISTYQNVPIDCAPEPVGGMTAPTNFLPFLAPLAGVILLGLAGGAAFVWRRSTTQ